MVGKSMLNTRSWGFGLLMAVVLLIITPLSEAYQVPIPTPPKGRGGQCVEDTQFMRRNHMNLIFHKRDLTMRQGIRTPTHSLKECIGCHAGQRPDGTYIPANDEGQFCQSCHSYVGAQPDCFECHATTPAILPANQP
ncbi:Hdr-like menaquinol oxidoreductase cytochrome c subunit [Gammaproteobacteria bacterium]